MTSYPLLLTPGPTPVPPEIRKVLGQPILHHRTPEFQAILKEVSAGLKEVFGTKEEVYLLTSSGTGAMEAAVVNLFSAGDEVLVIQGGKFGERWAEICQAYGMKVHGFDTPWGKPIDLNKLRGLFEGPASRKYKAVFSTLCETSTGVTYDLRAIRKAMGNSEALLIVDAISGLLSEPFAMDAFGADAAVSGSQKGLMLPPGLSFIALSRRAQERIAQSKLSKYYHSLRLVQEAWEDTDTPFTPAISLITALAESLKQIRSRGLERILETHRRNAQAIRKAMSALGLELYADPACASNGVTSVKVPAGINGKELLKKLRLEQGVILAGGQAELSGKIFRIASMGAIGMEEIEQALQALEKVLEELGWKIPSAS